MAIRKPSFVERSRIAVLLRRSLSGASVKRLQKLAASRESAVSATALMSVTDSDVFFTNLRIRIHA
jgi:hypothetical protein